MLIGLRVSAEELHDINVVVVEETEEAYALSPLRKNPTIPSYESIVGAFTLPELMNIEYTIYGEELL